MPLKSDPEQRREGVCWGKELAAGDCVCVTPIAVLRKAASLFCGLVFRSARRVSPLGGWRRLADCRDSNRLIESYLVGER